MTIGLVAGLALASLAFALALEGLPGAQQKPAAPPAVAAPPGKAAFVQHCGGCHAAGEFTAQAQDPKGAADMVRFLEGHGRASLEEDLLIVAFLAAGGQ